MKLPLLLGIIAQALPGLWFTPEPVEYRGLMEGDAITFSIPVEEKLPAGTYVQFGVTLENNGDKAPRYYIVEVLQGKKWECLSTPVFNDGLSGYSFFTVPAKYAHPSTYIDLFRLRQTVQDTLKVRCRVCSHYTSDRTALFKDDPANSVSMKSMHYVGARLNPLGRKVPIVRKKVLMLGNSFTYFYGVPFMLQEIAFSQGIELDINASLKGGQTFRQHSGLTMSLVQCSLEKYDYAFLQGQSQESARYAEDPSGQRDVKSALLDLCDALRSTSPDCKVFVENTWAYGAGDCGGFGSLERFDELLTEGSGLLAVACRGESIPVGPAFAAVRADGSSVNLLGDDDKHQSLAGSYLKACVEYLVISGKPFSGTVPSCGLPESDAAYLRSIAEKTVLK
ncbi:MAG: hypothetical protein J5737_00570 [Bacteroidales bacterium]|nr:hypothetical protein [Bacteroidales bacterium]